MDANLTGTGLGTLASRGYLGKVASSGAQLRASLIVQRYHRLREILRQTFITRTFKHVLNLSIHPWRRWDASHREKTHNT